MSVTVLGTDYDNVDGLQASLDAHNKAHRDNGAILLNLADAAAARKNGEKGPKKGDPRPPYVHQEYPMDLKHADGRTRTVRTPEEAERVMADHGFRKEPYPVVRVAVGDPGAEKAALQLKLSDADGKIASQNEMLLKMAARLDALEKAPAILSDPDTDAGDETRAERRAREKAEKATPTGK